MAGKAAVFLFLAMVLSALGGCSVAIKPQLGAISVSSTDPATTTPTPINSLTVSVSSIAYVSVAVGQDPQNLGVYWDKTCGGSPNVPATANPCGTLAADTNVVTQAGRTCTQAGYTCMIYTAPDYIPVGNTVTITAYSTSDPSVSSSVTLTIVAKPITIALTGTPTSALEGSEQISLIATVSNDENAQGVIWSMTCSLNNCGTLVSSNSGAAANVTLSGSQMYYTAPPPSTIPAGGATIKITAASIADSSKTATATITVEPISVAFVVNQGNTVPEGTTANLTATVVYDNEAEHGVNWSVSCSSSITTCPGVTGAAVKTLSTASLSYTVTGMSLTVPAAMPVGSTITLTATSITDPSKTATTTITVGQLPQIQVCFEPLTGTTCPTSGGTVSGGSVQVGGTGQLGTSSLSAFPSVLVMWDSNSNMPGVTWALTCGSSSTGAACGTITAGSANGSQTSYIVPAKYTAPSAMPSGGSTVTLTATSVTATTSNYAYPNDPTQSASATITLVQPITVAITTAPSPITAGTAASFVATVKNDIASAGVTWSASCSNGANPCGSFTTSQTTSGTTTTSTTSYTAPLSMPSGSTVTVTAASTASSTVPPLVSATSTVNVTPVIQTSFVPYAPTQMVVSDSTTNQGQPVTVSLTAVVANDKLSTGVTWTSGGAGSGTCSSGGNQFLVSPQVAAVGTIQRASAQCTNSLTVPNGAAVAYIPPSTIPLGGTVTITATDATTATKTSLATATATVSIVSTLTKTGVQLNGTVQAGTTPVAGASVSLYAAGTSGYYTSTTQPLASLTSVATGSNGSFTIPAGYTCPSQSSQMYLVATGGNPGLTGSPTPSNGQLAMMTALGPCSGLSSAVNLVLNEVTTVASVWALAPFMPSSLPGGSYAYVNSSSGNATTGLANAFATVNNLVNITTGQALTSTPASNSAVPYAGNTTVPQAEINTLADILNTCTATKGGAVGDNSACAKLFAYTNPGTTTTTAPVDTVQAALNMAQYNIGGSTQANAISALYGLISATPPFTPTLTAAPNDWTIALSFIGGGVGGSSQSSSQSTALAIDALGHLWIANGHINSVSEMNNLGVALSPATTGTTKASGGGYKGGGQVNSPAGIAIDPRGNVWVLNSSSTLSELYGAWASYGSSTVSGAGAAVSSTAFSGGGLASGNGLAIDGTSTTSGTSKVWAGNVWATSSGSPGSLAEFAGPNTTINNVLQNNGSPLSPSGGYTSGINTPSGAVAVDKSGTVWVLNSGNKTAAEYDSTSTSGTPSQIDTGCQTVTSTGVCQYPVLTQYGVGSSMAIDSTGDVWTIVGQNLIELKAGGTNSLGQGVSTTLIGNPSSALAVDGASHLWSVFTGGGSSNCTVASVVELNSSASALNTNATGCGYVGTSLGNTAIAVDGSGNVWVLNGNNSSNVTEFIGVATPVVTPFSLGVMNGTPGWKP